MWPSAETTSPVVDPVPTSMRPIRSSPPTVSMRTTDGRDAGKRRLHRPFLAGAQTLVGCQRGTPINIDQQRDG